MRINKINLFASVAFVLLYNGTFWRHVTEQYPVGDNIFFLMSMSVMLFAAHFLILSILNYRYTYKPLLVLFFLTGAFVAYFSGSYDAVISEKMIQNLAETDPSEVQDLLSLKMFLYVGLLGILPSIFVIRSRVEKIALKKAVFSRIAAIGISVIVIFLMLFSFSRSYTSFFREHKPLRYYINPLHAVYSAGRYVKHVASGDRKLVVIGEDAVISHEDRKPRLMIFIVGEAVRADHLPMNGYGKDTTPYIQRLSNLYNFTNFYSCGTETAVSVPCMFSYYDRNHFSLEKGKYTYNVLDVLHKSGVNVLWRENNSSSKNVADRMEYEYYKNYADSDACKDGTCYDEVLLTGLSERIDSEDGDTIIVLHVMGDHGPAYYKRYPESFEKFTPVCKTNELKNCTPEEISNAYDNAVLYGDYVLNMVVDVLKTKQEKFDTAMWYVSDHGESLGENGIYLHAIPYFMAPDAQKHVGTFMWMNDDLYKDYARLNGLKDKELTHDYVFHSLLGFWGVKTSVYDENLDIFKVER